MIKVFRSPLFGMWVSGLLAGEAVGLLAVGHIMLAPLVLICSAICGWTNWLEIDTSNP